MNKNLKYVAVGVLSALLVLSFAKICSLENQIGNLNSNISSLKSQLSSLNSNVSSIYSNIDKKLEEEASILSGYDYTVGDFDINTQTVEISLKVTPKEISDEIKVHAKLGTNTVELTKNGAEFVGKINVGLFEEYEDSVLVSLTYGEITKNEYLQHVWFSGLFEHFLPQLSANSGGKTALTGNQLKVEHTVTVDPWQDGDIAFTKFELIEELNGKELARSDITEKVEKSSGGCEINFNKKYTAEAGDIFKIIVRAEDELGYIHEVIAYNWYKNDDATADVETIYGGETIYDSDGNLMWGFKN